MLKICLIEACEKQDKGSIGAFYIEHHARLAGFEVDRLDTTKKGYDVELISLHHCNDFPRLAKMPKRAKFRLVGGHPMQNNPRPVIPYADAIGIGEGETWIKNILKIIDETGSLDAAVDLPGTIVTKYWHNGDPVPQSIVETPLPDNPPYLNRPGTLSAAWYVEMARGCPFRCAYCELGHSTKYREYSAEHLKKVIDSIDISKARKINFYAPDEASHPSYNELYQYLESRGFSASFSSMRVDSVLRNPPLIKPNHLIRVGVDGLTEETRIRVNKKITDDMIYDYFKMLIDRGHITFKMFMIIGYPWDTLEDFDKWERMMRRLMSIPLKKNISLRIKWTPFIPQPCTPLGGTKANYTWEMYEWVENWHARHKRPRTNPGWYIENDGIMSHASHQRQCNLTAGDETILIREFGDTFKPWYK